MLILEVMGSDKSFQSKSVHVVRQAQTDKGYTCWSLSGDKVKYKQYLAQGWMRISALSLKVLCENFYFLSQTAITVVLRQLWHNTLPRDRLELNQVYTCFRLLVGAPKEKAESGVSANETGDVYACPITADRKDCRRLNLLSSSKFPDIHTSHEGFFGA